MIKKFNTNYTKFYALIVCLGFALATVQPLYSYSKSNYLATRDFYLNTITNQNPFEILANLLRTHQEQVLRNQSATVRHLKERFRYEVFEGPHPFDPLEDLAKVDMVHDAIFEDAFKKLARAVRDTYARFREHRSHRASTVEEIG